MRAKEEAFRILEAALSIASAGVDEAEVCLGGGSLGITSFSQNQVHPAEEQNVEILSVRMGVDGKLARMRTTDLSTTGIKDLAQRLRAQVEHMPEPATRASLPAPQSYEEMDAYDPETEAMRDLDREALAAKAIMAATKNDLVASGYVAVRRGAVSNDGAAGVYAVANTRGLLAYHPETRVTFSVAMQARDGTRGWAEDESFTVSALEPDEIVRSATKRAMLGGRPARVAPGTFTAILEPAVVAELLRHVGATCGAAALEDGTSFLSGRLGEKVAAASINLREDFAHALHRGTPFDAEGVAREAVPLIDKGVAKGAVAGWRSAQRLGIQPTGHTVLDPELGETEVASYLVLEGGGATFGDLVGSTPNGILISRLTPTQLIDPRSLTVSGATRDGLFLIEGGEPVTQLEDMCFTVSVLDLLMGVEALTGATWAHGAVVPAVKVAFPLSLGVS
ncbi:MAG: TldD/PmbA family protein [Myxococcales bacterium]|nr:TldD/PmbA family protein [Myxococcales bacterium]MCB9651164.1 TldD/PmbA family protein [Deltaproteobacteria bacterium]